MFKRIGWLEKEKERVEGCEKGLSLPLMLPLLVLERFVNGRRRDHTAIFKSTSRPMSYLQYIAFAAFAFGFASSLVDVIEFSW